MKNIIGMALIIITLFTACEKKEENREVKLNDNTNSKKDIVIEVQDKSLKVIESIKEKTDDIISSSKVVKDELLSKSGDIKDKIDDTITEIIKTKDEESVDAKILFMKCAGCHGQSAEKSALSKSKIIKGWDSPKIEAALIGYKNGTYGGNMKGVMISQVSNLTNDEIKALSEYISKF